MDGLVGDIAGDAAAVANRGELPLGRRHGDSGLMTLLDRLEELGSPEALAKKAAEQEKYNEELRRGITFADGLDSAMVSFGSTAVLSAERGRDAFEGFADAIHGTIDDAVQDGKLSLDSLEAYFLEFASRLAGDFLLQQLFGLGLNLLGVSGPGFGATPTQYSLTGGGDAFRGRASGGPVARGSPYIVGERGPEFFVPNSSGMILSNRDSRAAMSGRGGGGNTIVVHVEGQSSEADRRRTGAIVGKSVAASLAAVGQANQDSRRRGV